MRIALLGGARLEGDAGAAELRTRQGACVLAFLTLNRDRAVTRHELADALWPGPVPATWDTTLRVVISRVRAALTDQGLDGRAVLAASPSGYRLDLPDDVVVDVDELAARLASAVDAWNHDRPLEALTKAAAAAALAGATLLPGEEGDWLRSHRDRITRQRFEALELSCRAAIALGNAPAAIRAADEAVSVNPIHEASHRLLMSAHAAAGDRAAALDAYERCRTLLTEQLGTDPSPETSALHQEILRMSAVGAGPAPRIPGPLRAQATAFAGRLEELSALHAVLDRASGGITEVAVVSGEPGIGKTRLCAELAREAVSREAAVLYGRCNEDPIGSYEPFVEALSRRLREWPELASVIPPALLRLLPGIETDVASPVRDPLTERLRLFEGIADVLEVAAGDAPVALVILDDLHWADRSTLLLLEHIVRARPVSRLAIMCTFRGAEPPALLRDTLAELTRTRAVTRLCLTGLGTPDVERLVDDWAPGSGRHLAAALAERTDGNPFFLLEILRHLREGTETVHLTAAGFDAAGTPAGVRDVIHRRLARLSQDARDVLLAASVIGREFDVDLLERLADASVDVVLALQEAADAGIVAEVPDAMGQYRFSHHLVRQVLYEDLTKTRRARQHLRTGEALESMVAGSAGDRTTELAHHFATAAPSAGSDKAVRYLALAGDRAMAVLAFEEAAGHYQRALSLAGADEDAVRARLLISIADAQARAGEVKLAWRTLQDALPFAELAGLLEELGAALVRATSSLATDWDQEAWEIGHWGLARLGHGDSPVRSILLSRMALSTQSFGAPPEATQHTVSLSVRALEMAERLGHPTALRAAIQARILCDPSPELLPRRLELIERLVSLSTEGGDETLLMNAYLWLGMEHLARGEMDRARSSIEAFDRLGEATAHPWAQWRLRVSDTNWAIMRGDFEGAEQAVQAEFEAGIAAKVPQAMIYYAGHLFQLRREQGRMSEIEHAMTALGRLPDLIAWEILLYIGLGRLDQARSLFARVAQDDFASLAKRYPGWWMDIAQLSYACDEFGDVERAKVLIELLAPCEGRHIVQAGLGGYWGPVDLALGGLAATLSDYERAEPHLLRAIEMCGDVRTPTWKARAQLRLGRVLLERDVTRARALLEEAGEAAERMGMAGLVAQARAFS